jgi:integration host factor subunit beta
MEWPKPWPKVIVLRSGGVCSFFLKKYGLYIGHNPKTGENVKIKPKNLPFFKAGKELKERVDR